VYKVPDAKTMGVMMSTRVPTDIMLSKDGLMYTIECKSTKMNRFPIANLKEHQIEWSKSCPRALFLVYFNNRQKGDRKVERTFLFDYEALLSMTMDNSVSIPIPAFEQHAIELQRKTAKHHPNKEGAFIDFKRKSL
jgi:penicillin-binding protein-related factor A (putative recombinase)